MNKIRIEHFAKRLLVIIALINLLLSIGEGLFPYIYGNGVIGICSGILAGLTCRWIIPEWEDIRIEHI